MEQGGGVAGEAGRRLAREIEGKNDCGGGRNSREYGSNSGMVAAV